jgi:hypothetical protein
MDVRGRDWPGCNTDRGHFDKITLAWCRIISSSRIAPEPACLTHTTGSVVGERSDSTR